MGQFDKGLREYVDSFNYNGWFPFKEEYDFEFVFNNSERANYRKMRSFFVGPKWVADRDSSYARGADYRLKETLHKLYPTLPDQL